jgi:hypothetical protein
LYRGRENVSSHLKRSSCMNIPHSVVLWTTCPQRIPLFSNSDLFFIQSHGIAWPPCMPSSSQNQILGKKQATEFTATPPSNDSHLREKHLQKTICRSAQRKKAQNCLGEGASRRGALASSIIINPAAARTVVHVSRTRSQTVVCQPPLPLFHRGRRGAEVKNGAKKNSAREIISSQT